MAIEEALNIARDGTMGSKGEPKNGASGKGNNNEGNRHQDGEPERQKVMNPDDYIKPFDPQLDEYLRRSRPEKPEDREARYAARREKLNAARERVLGRGFGGKAGTEVDKSEIRNSNNASSKEKTRINNDMKNEQPTKTPSERASENALYQDMIRPFSDNGKDELRKNQPEHGINASFREIEKEESFEDQIKDTPFENRFKRFM